MQRKLVVEFTKMSGAGNDFIVVDNRFYNFTDAELSELARRYCPRRTGIGADGILGFSRPEDPAHHYRMRYFNADGSLGTMCGNGARCLARFAWLAGMQEPELIFESDAGIYRAHVDGAEGDVRLYVQPPQRYQPEVPLESTVAGEAGPGHFLWTGTEHLVCFVDDVERTPVAQWGPSLRRDPALGPIGANVNFVEPVSDGYLRVRTFEKGVEAETLACGTGAMASAIIARLQGQIASNPVEVHMPGGILHVGFDLNGHEVRNLYLEGPAEVVFRGSFEW